MTRLDGKVAIVTGGAQGMGASHVRRLVSEGASVVIADILEDEGRALSAELGASAIYVALDVTDADRWRTAVDDAEAAFGAVDVLVNNAGILTAGSVETIAEADYRHIVDVNQVGVLLGMQAVVGSMRRAGAGSIVNVSSTAGLTGVVGAIGYAASKWAVRGMTKCAALDLVRHNIRVNAVLPGIIKTPMTVGVVEAAITKMTPMARAGESGEVSALVCYLASEESSFCTGAEFVVDGGLTAR